ncbi:MAG: hypothetical protein Q9227_007330 [Pyrenula ochraceoflavens]
MCDKKLPKCGQCIRTGIQCEYRSHAEFVVFEQPPAKTKKDRPDQTASDAIGELTSTISLIASANELGISDKFLRLFHANTQMKTSKFENAQTVVKLYQSSPLQRTSSTCLQDIYMALSCSHVAEDLDSPEMTKESMARYGRALRGLRKLLSDPAHMRADVALTTCCLLSLYELREVQSDTLNFLVHNQPVAQMMYAYGPSFFTKGTAHKLFTGLRLSVITSGIQFQTSTFLEKNDWKTVPFSKKPPSAFQRLLNVMVHIPALLEGMNILKETDAAQSTVLAMKLTEDCEKLEEDLSDWFERDRGNWKEVPSIQPDVPLNVVYEFNDYVEAHGLIIYWACRILVHSVSFWSQQQRGQQAGQDLFLAKEAAMSIVRSITWFLKPEQGVSGRYIICFPMGVAAKIIALPVQHQQESHFFRAPKAGDRLMFEEASEIMRWLRYVMVSLNMKGLPIRGAVRGTE